MKRIVMLLLLAALCLGLFSCALPLRLKFPDYYGLDPMKGLEVYVWQNEDGTHACGILSGTNRLKTEEELSALREKGASIAEMKIILSSYDLPDDSIAILPLFLTSDETEWARVRALFD